MRYTFDQVLWVTGKGDYRVKNRDGLVLDGHRVDSLGKLAGRYRNMRGQRIEAKFWSKLPGLPGDIREAILRIAAYQDGWAERQQVVDEEAERIAQIGRWDD